MDIDGWVSGGILSIITKWMSHLVSMQTHYSDQCVLSVSVGFSTRGKDSDLAPSNSKTTFVQSTGTQRFLRNILTLSGLYSLESPH